MIRAEVEKRLLEEQEEMSGGWGRMSLSGDSIHNAKQAL
jgi:hypothetical protein